MPVSAATKIGGIDVLDIREALEAARERFEHGDLALHAPPGVRTPWHLEHAIIGEVGHDGVGIVGVEGFAQGSDGTPDIAHRTLPPR